MSENGAVPKHLMLRALANVEARQVRFLVPGLIPLRTLTLVAGVGGLGKSTWLAGIAARVSRGDLGEPGNVIIVSFEDTTEEMLRPRVEAAGGDLGRVFDVIVPEHQAPIVLPGDLGQLRECIREIEARLVIIDPIVAAIDVSFDAHKDQHVRVVLAELAALAEQEDLAVAMVGHLNKAPSRDAYIRVANSVAFWNAARSVVLVTEDPDEPDSHRLVAQRKANFARLAPIERHLVERAILSETLDQHTGNPVETSRVVFVEYAADVDADDLLGPRERMDTKESLGGRYLAAALADGEWHDSAGLKTLAAAAGISDRTLQRAAQDLDVEHKREGFPASTWWRLRQLRQGLSQESGASVDPARLRRFDPPRDPSCANPVGDGLTGATERRGRPRGHLTAEERNALKAGVDRATREELESDKAAQQNRDRQLDPETDTSEADYWAERTKAVPIRDKKPNVTDSAQAPKPHGYSDVTDGTDATEEEFGWQ